MYIFSAIFMIIILSSQMANGLNQKYNHERLYVPFWYLYALLMDFPALVTYQTVRNTSEHNRHNRQLKMLSALTFLSFH